MSQKSRAPFHSLVEASLKGPERQQITEHHFESCLILAPTHGPCKEEYELQSNTRQNIIFRVLKAFFKYFFSLCWSILELKVLF